MFSIGGIPRLVLIFTHNYGWMRPGEQHVEAEERRRYTPE